MKEPDDNQWMRVALELAQEALGMTSPNPMVGAVVVKDGQLIGKGYHHKAGQPHAEPNALDNAGDQTLGATLYVTLEPCCTFGRTPPCTERIIRSGIRRVVIGSLDSNPKHRGAGVDILRNAGIEVEVGVLQEECLRLNESFFWWIQHHKPFVILKMGMTLDGKIATATGESQWITGSDSRQVVQKLRRWADAIMVGGRTAELDSPSLRVREPADWPRQPQRYIWSSRAISLPQMANDGAPAPHFAKPETPEDWDDFLKDLGKQEITALLLEGGGELASAALRAGAVNKVAFFVAPKILGGRESAPVVGGYSPRHLSEALSLKEMKYETVGDDLLITGYCANVYGIN